MLKMFLTKYGEWCKKVRAKRFKMLMSSVARTRSSRMVVAGPDQTSGLVCLRLCHQTKGHAWKQEEDISRANCESTNCEYCSFAGLYSVKHLRPKGMNDCNLHICACLSYHLHCCTELKFTVQQLSLNVLYAFNTQPPDYNCNKFHSNWFRNISRYNMGVQGSDLYTGQ